MNVAIRSMPLEMAQAPGTTVSAVRPARVEVFNDIGSTARYWRKIEADDGIYSPYQGYDWVRLWHEHVSGPADQTPCIVVGFDDRHEPLFLWPLLRTKLGPLNVASFFGGKHAALNLTLWRSDAARAFTIADMNAVLTELARQAPDLDFLMLSNQPESWRGLPNPFALLPHQTGTEDNYIMRLGLPGSQIITREISSSMRSRLRNRERKLAKLPGYRYLKATGAEDIDRLLAAFFAQKASKLTALGLENVFARPGVGSFIRTACCEGLADGRPVIELHALEGDGEMLALFSGIHDGHRFTLMFASHTASEHSRQSPGLILLQHVVADCADRGFESFDIGPGEAHYKTVFCKEFEPIFESILPLSARGHVLAIPLRGLFRLKSTIKRNRILWRVASTVRSALNRITAGTS
jgi:CelD/BcsL family acetyltransferase involved in cellulose biosynthesis